MIVKSRKGHSRGAFVRKPIRIQGRIESLLIPSKRAGHQVHRRFKRISKALECGREPDFFGDLQMVHRLDRRHVAAELKSLVQSGGYQADIVKAGRLIPVGAIKTEKEQKKAVRSKAIIVGPSGQVNYVY